VNLALIIEALQIIARNAASEECFFRAAHDQVWVGSSDLSRAEEDIARLEELGWFIDEDSWSHFIWCQRLLSSTPPGRPPHRPSRFFIPAVRPVFAVRP
jgi:hypothetical protein